ncbi:MAG: CpaF family protein, partial [Bacilli bacterium]|nr:CpaF family protein [Bacilli bacterium]
NRLIEPVGKTIDVNNPMVDARLEDGSRINAVIPPLSKNPVITIRKFKKNIVTMDDLVANGTLTPYMAEFLEVAVKAKLNILVAGPSGSGKTTLLNILGNYIDEKERIITIEDVMELNLKQKHVVSLETKNANYDGVREVTVRDLVRNSLRMRPDRIIIGEVRGSEAFDLLQAMNSGHDGSLTTLHANSSKDALSRLETMILMDGLKIPMGALREYVGNAIDLIVYITRMKDGKRKIVDISEVIDNNDSENALRNIFEFKSSHINENGSVSGEFIQQKYKPEVLKKIKMLGINDLDKMFNK